MRIHRFGWAGALAISVALAACGGGSGEATPTALPSTVAIQSAAQAEVNTDTPFSTGLDSTLTGLRYRWDFGDGNSSSSAQPTHRYASPGEYTVAVTVTNEAGQARSASFTVRAGHFANVAGNVCAGDSSNGWCWQQPKPTGQLMSDVYFVDANTGWAVGESGAILKTTDGGSSWIRQNSGVTSNLWLVRFVDANNGWAAGTGNAVLHTTDSGAHWQTQATGFNSGYTWGYGAFWALDRSRAVYANNATGTSYATEDGGNTWQAAIFNPSVVTPGGTLWAFDGNGLRRSTDLGKTATQPFIRTAPTQSIDQIAFADDNHGLILTREQPDPNDYSNLITVLWRTTDGGGTWSRQATTLGPSSYSPFLHYSSTGEVWLNTYAGLFRSTDHGATWANIPLPSGLSPYGVAEMHARDGNTLWFTAGNNVYLSTDAGTTWRTLGVTSELSYPRLQLLSNNTLWLSYSNYYYSSTSMDRAYRSTDAGTSWTQVLGGDLQDTNANLQSVWFFDAQHGIALGSNGTLVETTNGGIAWTRKSLAPGNSFYNGKLQFQSATTGWLMAGGSAIYKTTDGGASWWAPLMNLSFNGLSDFHFVDEQNGWAINSAGTIYRSTDGGQSWSLQAATTYSMNGIRFANASRGVAVGSNGALALSTDGGVTWQPRVSGVFQTLKRVTWTDPSTAWVVGDYGTVLTSTDGGLSWTQVAVPSSTNLNDVVFVDAQHGWLVGDFGTVLYTGDGGRTWTRQSTNTSRSFYGAFFTDARTGWLVGSGGAILATASGGR